MLLKQKHSAWSFEKKMTSSPCLKQNFLITGFTQHMKKLAPESYLQRYTAWQSPFLARKFQILGARILQKKLHNYYFLNHFEETTQTALTKYGYLANKTNYFLVSKYIIYQ